MKRNVRRSKYEPVVDEIELIEANPHYAHVRFPDGRETTVSTKQLAPAGTEPERISYDAVDLLPNEPNGRMTAEAIDQPVIDQSKTSLIADKPDVVPAPVGDSDVPSIRRSTRIRKLPDKLNL